VPEVSVIMNCYNGAKYLRQAIDSVFAQSFADWELIFWDNASTDESGEIAQGYDDGRMRYFRAAVNVPLGEARKLAMAQAHGKWIGFLDTDDYWYPDKLTRQIAALGSSDAVLCYAGIANVTPDGTIIREVLPRYADGDQFEMQLKQFEINMVTPLIRREVLLSNAIEFEPEITASEEYNLFMRLLTKGPVKVVSDVLGAWRMSPGSLTDRQIGRLHIERRLTLAQLARENPGIERRYPHAFEEAFARADYYEARFAMSLKDRGRAFHLLAKNWKTDLRYLMLSLGTLLPGVWQLIHTETLKLKFLPRVLRIARVR
jgi:glycosyltransferase involved in cell wall biosynthesis